VTTTSLAEAYRARIRAVVPQDVTFDPLMTIYLTDTSSPDDIADGFARGSVTACKLYPAHATTNSAHGVTDIRAIAPVLERMQRIGMPLSAAPDANDWIDWASTTRMNEQISPALALLRSTSHRRHWVVTLLAVLDATALRSVITTEPPAPDDIQLLAVGAIALDVLAHAPQDSDGTTNWSLEEQVLEALHLPLEQLPEPTPAAVGVAAGDVAAAIDGLRRSGIAIANDENVIWRRFAALRATYYAPAADLARRLQAVPAPWSGSRDPDNPVLWPQRSVLLGGG
jgi:hypothetical protein